MNATSKQVAYPSGKKSSDRMLKYLRPRLPVNSVAAQQSHSKLQSPAYSKLGRNWRNSSAVLRSATGYAPRINALAASEVCAAPWSANASANAAGCQANAASSPSAGSAPTFASTTQRRPNLRARCTKQLFCLCKLSRVKQVLRPAEQSAAERPRGHISFFANNNHNIMLGHLRRAAAQ